MNNPCRFLPFILLSWPISRLTRERPLFSMAGWYEGTLREKERERGCWGETVMVGGGFHMSYVWEKVQTADGKSCQFYASASVHVKRIHCGNHFAVRIYKCIESVLSWHSEYLALSWIFCLVFMFFLMCLLYVTQHTEQWNFDLLVVRNETSLPYILWGRASTYL